MVPSSGPDCLPPHRQNASIASNVVLLAVAVSPLWLASIFVWGNYWLEEEKWWKKLYVCCAVLFGSMGTFVGMASLFWALASRQDQVSLNKLHGRWIIPSEGALISVDEVNGRLDLLAANGHGRAAAFIDIKWGFNFIEFDKNYEYDLSLEGLCNPLWFARATPTNFTGTCDSPFTPREQFSSSKPP